MSQEEIPGGSVAAPPPAAEPAAAPAAEPASEAPPSETPAAEEIPVSKIDGVSPDLGGKLENTGVLVLKRYANRAFDLSKPVKSGWQKSSGVFNYIPSFPAWIIPDNPFSVPILGSVFQFLLGGGTTKIHRLRKFEDNNETGDEFMKTNEVAPIWKKIFLWSNRSLNLKIIDGKSQVGTFKKSAGGMPFFAKAKAVVYDGNDNVLGYIEKPGLCEPRKLSTKPGRCPTRPADKFNAVIMYQIKDNTENKIYLIAWRTGCFCKGYPISIYPVDATSKEGGASIVRTHKFCSKHWLSGGIFSSLQSRIKINFPAQTNALVRYLIVMGFIMFDFDRQGA